MAKEKPMSWWQLALLTCFAAAMFYLAALIRWWYEQYRFDQMMEEHRRTHVREDYTP